MDRAVPVSRSAGACYAAAVALAGAVLLALHARSFLPFLSDDALISLRYARRLLQGSGLTWNDGERVEGYSNLLWVLLCAALGGLGMDLIGAARLLGLAAAAATVAALAWSARPRVLDEAPAAPAAVTAAALSGPLAAWSVGGLETTLLAALLAWACALALPLCAGGPTGRRGAGPGALLALLCLTRPDGPLLVAGLCAGVLAARGSGHGTLRLILWLALPPLAAVAAQMLFRLGYYGHWLPTSASVKLALDSSRWSSGLGYVSAGLASLAGLALPAALLALPPRGSDAARLRFLAPPLLLWSAYVALLAYDIMPARRHMVPILVLLCLALAQGVRGLARSRPALRVAGWMLAALCLLAHAIIQRDDPENRHARHERWVWDGQVVGRMLARGFGAQRPLLAVSAAGCLPYFSELPALDLLGLNDAHLARRRPRDMGAGVPGHELGDGAYVLAREPDLVIFCGPAGSPSPCFRSGSEMVAVPMFFQRYKLVTFQGSDPYVYRSQIWVRTEGGTLGAERTTGSVTIPGYLVCDHPDAVAALDAHGRVGMLVREEPARLDRIDLAAGRWRLEAESSDPPVRARLTRGAGGALLAEGEPPLDFDLPEAAAIDLSIHTVWESGTILHRVVLKRRPEYPP